MLVKVGFLVSVDKAGMSARAYWNFAEMLVDETVLSVLMVRRLFRVSEEKRKIGPNDGYFLDVSDVCV